MELTGTLEERIAAAVKFAKAHRAHEYDLFGAVSEDFIKTL
jgi:hypothetical protein